jgi:hypothetical protein
MERAGDRAGSRRQAPRTQRLPAHPIMTDLPDTGTQGHTTRRFNVHRLCRVTPGSRISLRLAVARPGHESGRVRGRGSRMSRWPSSRFTMSNSAVLFVPAARCCARVCGLPRICFRSLPLASPRGSGRRPSRQQQFRPPDEGWMERRQPHSQLRSRLRRATPHPGATGITLGAPPWRFSDADPRSRLPAVEPEPAATSRARPYDWRSGSGPPCGAVRAASAGRHSRLRLAGSFLENAPSEPGCKSCTINSLRSQ